MTAREFTQPAPASLIQVIAPFAETLMTDKMRAYLQSAADAYLARKIYNASGIRMDGPLVSVLVSADFSIAVFLKNRAAVAPLRRAGFTLTPFKLRKGRAEVATSSTADGWEIDEGVES